MNIFLIGYRGTGKSSLAPRVAAELGNPWQAVDLDGVIEARAKKSIARIFADEGEPAFRDAEQSALAEVAKGDAQVVATGGGAIGRAENRAVLQQGWVVWLTATPQTIHRRLAGDAHTATTRPKLTGQTDLDEITSLLTEREPIYRSLANLILDTESTPLAELADRIADTWRQRSD